MRLVPAAVVMKPDRTTAAMSVVATIGKVHFQWLESGICAFLVVGQSIRIHTDPTMSGPTSIPKHSHFLPTNGYHPQKDLPTILAPASPIISPEHHAHLSSTPATMLSMGAPPQGWPGRWLIAPGPSPAAPPTTAAAAQQTPRAAWTAPAARNCNSILSGCSSAWLSGSRAQAAAAHSRVPTMQGFQQRMVQC